MYYLCVRINFDLCKKDKIEKEGIRINRIANFVVEG